VLPKACALGYSYSAPPAPGAIASVVGEIGKRQTPNHIETIGKRQTTNHIETIVKGQTTNHIETIGEGTDNQPPMNAYETMRL
jgi:hypothetical protein